MQTIEQVRKGFVLTGNLFTNMNGDNLPSESFHVLQDNALARFGEYRTSRLALEAWERMEEHESP